MNESQDELARLRARAEAALRATERPPLSTATLEEAQRATHELGVHQHELALVTDELLRVQRALRSDRDRLRDLYDHAPVGYCTLSADGQLLLEANLFVAALLGVERAGLLHASLGPFVERDDQDAWFLARRRLLESREPQRVELRLTAADGRALAVELTLVLARDVDGLEVIRAVLQDLTERRRIEAVAAQQVRLSSMGLLAAGVAHEINNPLAWVITSLEHLAETIPLLVEASAACAARRSEPHTSTSCAILGSPAFAECEQSAKDALVGAHRIQAIARRLGAFSRVEQTERTRVDVHRPIEAALAMAHNELRFRATVVRELDPVPPVLASEGKLTQLFLNLFVNAAHALGAGDPSQQRLTVRCHVFGPDVFVEVEDTGPGIAPALLARIFEPFFTTKPIGVGSGLGLSICRSLAAEFGGALTVSSPPGHGATFVLRLPVAPPLAPEAPARPAEVTAPAVSARPPRGRVLIVDDEELIRRSLARMLGKEHELVLVGSGVEAQALLQKDTAFDAVLTDLMMLELTGMALHEWLAANHPALARRVIFMSGGAFAPDAQRYLARTGLPLLDKPFDRPAVQRVLAEVVRAALVGR